MKRFLLILLAISCIMTATAQKANQKTLKQRVHRIEQINRQAQEITQKLDSIVLVNDSLCVIFNYDNQFNVTSVDFTMFGLSFNKISYYYDQQNRPIRIEETLFGDMESKTELSYNTEGLVSEEINYEYESTETWAPSTKINYEYDSQGKMLKAIEQRYEESSWENSYMLEYTYFAITNLLKYQTEFGWSYGEWEEYYKTEFEYDGQQNCTEYTEYYASVDDEWIGDTRSTFEYDSFGNCIKETDYDYAYSDDAWVISTIVNINYDNSVPASSIAGLGFYFEDTFMTIKSKLTKAEEISYEDGEPESSSVTVFYYSGAHNVAEVGGNMMIIRPNPVAETLTIDNAEMQQADIYSMDGRLVMTERSAESINVKSLPNGSYLLKVTMKDGQVATQKFVKQ